MSKVHIEAARILDNAPQQVYAVLADYRVGHPAILPKPEFSGITVVQGGHGAGSEIRFSATLSGRTRHFHSAISEPEAGRVLVESDLESDLVTRFIVDPLDGGTHARLTITTDYTTSAGVSGWIEALFSPLMMRALYNREMQNLAEYLTKSTSPAP